MARTRELLHVWSSKDEATMPKVLVFPMVLNSVSHYGHQRASTSPQGVLTRRDGYKLTTTISSLDFQLFWATLLCEGEGAASRSGFPTAHVDGPSHPTLFDRERSRLTLNRCSLVSDGEIRERMDGWELQDHEVVSQMPMGWMRPVEVSRACCLIAPYSIYRPLVHLFVDTRPTEV